MSTYIRRPPFLENLSMEPSPRTDITGARALAVLGDSITTDHISPAGAIKADSPAGKYLIEHGVEPKDFNSYGARRGNHEVMMRGHVCQRAPAQSAGAGHGRRRHHLLARDDGR